MNYLNNHYLFESEEYMLKAKVCLQIVSSAWAKT